MDIPRERQPLKDVCLMTLTVGIKEAHDLIAKDRCGTSDPYVKVKIDDQTVFRTKTIMRQLDPVWNELHEISLRKLPDKIVFSLYDYDAGSATDDFLGKAEIEMSNIEADKMVEHKLFLGNKKGDDKSDGKHKYRGYIIVATSLHYRYYQATSSAQRLLSDSTVENSQELDRKQQDQEQDKATSAKISKCFYEPTGKSVSVSKQQWRHVIDVVIGSVRDVHLPIIHNESPPLNFYLKIFYGEELRMTKAQPFPNNQCSANTRVFVGDRFTFFAKEDKFNSLTIELYFTDCDQYAVGDLRIDLNALSIEQTHRFDSSLSDDTGYIQMAVAITGTRPDVLDAIGNPPVPTWTPYGPPLIPRELIQNHAEQIWLKELADIFSLRNSRNLVVERKVAGVLVLKVLQARNLSAADVSGKSDPFVFIEIVNTRLRTHIEYKSLNPKWNRTFIIPIDDIHSILKVTVLDHDGTDAKPDFLGKTIIPLLRFQDIQGQRHWYSLRTRSLEESSKKQRGSIQLEGHLFYNKARATLRILDPKEERYVTEVEKINFKTLQKNINKVRKMGEKFFPLVDSAGVLMAWTYPRRSAASVVAWILGCYAFEPWMVPFALVIMFALTYFFAPREFVPTNEDQQLADETDDTDAISDSKLSLMGKLGKLEAITLKVNRALDTFLSITQRLRNIVLWRSPWISSAVFIAFALLTTLLYLIPVRWLIMIFGAYELLKKKIRPHAGFEAYHLISRAYCDREMITFPESKNQNK